MPTRLLRMVLLFLLPGLILNPPTVTASAALLNSDSHGQSARGVASRFAQQAIVSEVVMAVNNLLETRPAPGSQIRQRAADLQQSHRSLPEPHSRKGKELYPHLAHWLSLPHEGRPSLANTPEMVHEIEAIERYLVNYIRGHFPIVEKRSADFIQDLWVRVMQSSAIFKGNATVRSYLTRITHNLILDFLRRGYRREWTETSFEELRDQDFDRVDNAPGADELYGNGQSKQRLDGLLAQLPPAQRQVIRAKWEGMLFREIGAALHLQKGAVKKLYYSGLHVFSALYRAETGEEFPMEAIVYRRPARSPEPRDAFVSPDVENDSTVYSRAFALLVALDVVSGPLAAIAVGAFAAGAYLVLRYWNHPYRVLLRHLGARRNGHRRLPGSIQALAIVFGSQPIASVAQKVGWDQAYPVLMGLSLSMNEDVPEADLFNQAFLLRGVDLFREYLIRSKGWEAHRADLIRRPAAQAVKNAGFSKGPPHTVRSAAHSLEMIAALDLLTGQLGKEDPNDQVLAQHEAALDKALGPVAIVNLPTLPANTRLRKAA